MMQTLIHLCLRLLSDREGNLTLWPDASCRNNEPTSVQRPSAQPKNLRITQDAQAAAGSAEK